MLNLQNPIAGSLCVGDFFVLYSFDPKFHLDQTLVYIQMFYVNKYLVNIYFFYGFFLKGLLFLLDHLHFSLHLTAV